MGYYAVFTYPKTVNKRHNDESRKETIRIHPKSIVEMMHHIKPCAKSFDTCRLGIVGLTAVTLRLATLSLSIHQEGSLPVFNK